MNVKWDTEINGIILTDEETKLKKAPRPVFANELNLLKFDEIFEYNKESKLPLCWSINRKYFVNGKHFVTAKGGDICTLPTIRVFKDDVELKPIDIEKVLDRNSNALQKLEDNSRKFICDMVKKYPNYAVSVGYSGGKDSQVLIDLVNKAMNGAGFITVFANTALEHNFTYNNVDKTKQLYDFKINSVRPPRDAFDFFDLMGLPSRIRKWCTQVLKTVPLNNFSKKLLDDFENVLSIEGVRREESKRRSKYDPVVVDETNTKITKIRPLLDWNTSEIFLYIFKYNLPLNELYTYGLRRVGCQLCPNAAGWDESLLSNIDNSMDKCKDYIIKYCKDRGLRTNEEIREGLINGIWKTRAGGRYNNIETEAIFHRKTGDTTFKATLIKPTKDPIQYLKMIGCVQNNILYYQDNEFKFDITYEDNNVILIFYETNRDVRKWIRRALKKATYCIDCGLCESICEYKKCTGCKVCLGFTTHACLRAGSLYKTKVKQ